MSRSLLGASASTITFALITTATMSAADAQTTPSVSGPPKTYDVRDFFRKPERSFFRLAPDGKHLAYLAKGNGRQNVFVQDLDASGAPTGQATALTSESARDVSSFFWKGNGHIVYVKDFGGDENFHVLSVPIAGGAGKDLTPFDGVRAEIVDDLKDDDRHMLVSHNKRDKKVFDVFRVDVDERRRDSWSPRTPATSSPGSPITPASCAWRSAPTASTARCCIATTRSSLSGRS